MASIAPRVSVPSPAGTPAKEDSFAVLKALGEASAVFIALTFIGGWSYLSSYFKTFGLDPLELDLSMPVVSTISIYVLYQSVWPLFVAGALMLALSLVVRRLHRLGRGWIVGALCILLITVAAAGLFRGRQVADEDMLDNSRTLPYVAFATKTQFQGPPCVDTGVLGSLDCKLLLHYKNTYYFFESVPEKKTGSLNLYALSDSDLAGVHVQRGLDRNSKSE